MDGGTPFHQRVAPSPALCLHLLGGFRVQVGDRAVPPQAWKLRKAQHLIKLLALAPGHQLPREQVMDTLWPELDPEAAANNLRVALHAARRALAPARLEVRGDLLVLNPAATVCTDVAAFELAATAALQQADPGQGWATVELYAGDLLPEDTYADWAADRREVLRRQYLTLLVELAGWEEGRGEPARAILALERLVGTEPTDEAGQRWLMRLYAQTGRRQHALRQYAHLTVALRRELEVEPEAASLQLYQAILAGQVTPDRRRSSAAGPAPRPGTTVPAPISSFVGREPDLAEVREHLATARLLTLTGAGGVGKTRLALEVAARVHTEYADGVWLVELAALADPALVPQIVAAAVGVREQAAESLTDQLVTWLQPCQALLVLDNCEHLVAACAALVEVLLRACPRLRILATSRERLGLGGEVVWPVPSLAVPDPTRLPALDKLLQIAAVRLFVERARAAQPGFAVTPQHAAALARACRQLDGIPLAIELAAARVRVLSVEQIAARLDDCLRLLQGGSRTALPRHQTLKATLDWSYGLLAEPERLLLRRLAVFAGGFSLEAAEAVCGGEESGARDQERLLPAPWSLAPADVLDLLTHLVDKSLVMVEMQDSQPRYRLLETIRQYGRDRLVEAGELLRIRVRHRDWCLGLAERAEGELFGAALGSWLQRLESEHDNLRAALEFCLEGDADSGLRLAASLGRFWLDRGHLREGRRWLEAVLAHAPERNGARAKALFNAGLVCYSLGDVARAGSLLEESLLICREIGDRRQLGLVLGRLAHVALAYGDQARARALLEESLDLARATGDQRGAGVSLAWLGVLAARDGHWERAQVFLEESLGVFRQAGNCRGIGFALVHLGELARRQGDYGRAKAVLEEGLGVAREIGHSQGVLGALSNLGQLACCDGNWGRARVLFAEGLALAQECGDKPALGQALANLAYLARCEGAYDRSATLYKEGLAIFQAIPEQADMCHCIYSIGVVATQAGAHARGVRLISAAARQPAWMALAPAEQADCEASLAVARAALGQEAFATAWAAGEAMPLEAAIAEALGQEG